MAKDLNGSSYNRQAIETYWQARWEADGLWDIDVEQVDPDEKFYNLVEFPYPSAEGLHVGHVYTYCGADTFSRYQRMCGKKVFQPIGFDSFGIHTENFALRAGVHPQELTSRTIAHYREQLRLMGAAWNWDHEVVTSDPAYYRWTQWLFLQFYKAGLAVRKEAPVVWCPSCLTVLAHEQLEGGRCERCGTQVTEKLMRQWFLRTTVYADVLLDGLDRLDWPEVAKTLQSAWIGRSQGCEVDFVVKGSNIPFTAFTTRPDTLFGVTFLVLSPENPLLDEFIQGSEFEHAVRAFVTHMQIQALNAEAFTVGKTEERGVFVGVYVVNPVNSDEVPVYVADYVVSSYGAGIVMGVPAHDERDFEFAQSMGLPIRQVIQPEDEAEHDLWTGEGVLINSGPFSGQSSSEAKKSICEWLEESGLGRRASQYRLHDWLISRQRYWGPPIPIIYCQHCGTVPVPENQLPVLLPFVKAFRPTGTDRSPLAAVVAFVQVDCPVCGAAAQRETDVSDNFLDSSWYYLRYPSSEFNDRPWDPEHTARMLPVDIYFGGKEHIMRHHLYARFVVTALHDLGHLPFTEPFPRLRLHGLLNKDGSKMSKSRGNVVNPDEYVALHGADNLRMYLLFCGPWEDGGDFSDKGMGGIERFTSRVWSLVTGKHQPGAGGVDLRMVDRTIQKVQEGIERLKFNIAISGLMELTRWAMHEKPSMSSEEWQRTVRTLVLIMAPFAPYLAEELWSQLGGDYSVHLQAWPSYDERALHEDTFNLVIQINGKVRDVCAAPTGIEQEEAEKIALASEKVSRYLGGRQPRSIIYVADRLINLLV
jgi:leucyl-tRNA synthetase